MNNKHVPEALPKEYKILGNSDTFYLYCYFLTILLFQKWPKLKFDKFASYKTPSMVSLSNRSAERTTSFPGFSPTLSHAPKGG